jgi:hypothetical protein
MNPQIFNRKLFVSLGSEIDPHRFSQYSSNQKFEELQKPNGLVYFEVNNLLEAKILTQKFINEFDLGGSNWVGGKVIDEENNFIARISYNGRVWESENHPCKEIEI